MDKDRIKDIIETAAAFGVGFFSGWIWKNIWDHCPRWESKSPTDDSFIVTGTINPQDVSWCYFNSYDDALDCLQSCMHRAETKSNGYCEIVWYYDVAESNVQVSLQDYGYGWTLDQLKEAEILEAPKKQFRRWTIRLPEPERIGTRRNA